MSLENWSRSELLKRLLVAQIGISPLRYMQLEQGQAPLNEFEKDFQDTYFKLLDEKLISPTASIQHAEERLKTIYTQADSWPSTLWPIPILSDN